MWSKIPSEVGLGQQLLLLQHDLRQDTDAHLATKFWQTEICMIEWQVDVDHRCLVVQTVRRQCCLHCHINIVQQKKFKKNLNTHHSGSISLLFLHRKRVFGFGNLKDNVAPKRAKETLRSRRWSSLILYFWFVFDRAGCSWKMFELCDTFTAIVERLF